MPSTQKKIRTHLKDTVTLVNMTRVKPSFMELTDAAEKAEKMSGWKLTKPDIAAKLKTASVDALKRRDAERKDEDAALTARLAKLDAEIPVEAPSA